MKDADVKDRIRELETEVKALGIVYRKTKTYHNQVMLQNRKRERATLIAVLRNKIRLAVDNTVLLAEVG